MQPEEMLHCALLGARAFLAGKLESPGSWWSRKYADTADSIGTFEALCNKLHNLSQYIF